MTSSTLTESDVRAISRLASSPYFVRMSDTLLSSLDRKKLAELLAALLYLRSEGKGARELSFFFLTRETGLALELAIKIGPLLAAGVLLDSEFREIVGSLIEGAVGGKATRQ